MKMYDYNLKHLLEVLFYDLQLSIDNDNCVFVEPTSLAHSFYGVRKPTIFIKALVLCGRCSPVVPVAQNSAFSLY